MLSDSGYPDVLVVGAGVIGCTLAYELQKRGVATLLLDRGKIAREASWASAGIVGVPKGAEWQAPQVELAERSRKYYPELLESIEEETGQDSTYRHTGKLLIARTDSEVAAAQAQIDWQNKRGSEACWLEPHEVREIEPIISEPILGGYFTGDAGAMMLHRFTETVATAFCRLGGRVQECTPAVSVSLNNNRVTGVETEQGVLNAGTVVLAAGAWTRFFGPSLQLEFPVTPVKGQMISVHAGLLDQRPRHVLGSVTRGNFVPRPDGTVTIGATLEQCGFDKTLTPIGMGYAYELASTLAPSLAAASFVSAWTGLRPSTPDEMPIMGPVPGYDGLWISSGHSRAGALLAPGSAELVATAILDGVTNELLRQFTLDRFDFPKQREHSLRPA